MERQVRPFSKQRKLVERAGSFEVQDSASRTGAIVYFSDDPWRYVFYPVSEPRRPARRPGRRLLECRFLFLPSIGINASLYRAAALRGFLVDLAAFAGAVPPTALVQRFQQINHVSGGRALLRRDRLTRPFVIDALDRSRFLQIFELVRRPDQQSF